MSAVPDGCLYGISVPFVCIFGVRLHVDLTLLNMEIILDTQILKKFRVERILAAAFKDGALQAIFRAFWLKSEIFENSLRVHARNVNISKN